MATTIDSLWYYRLEATKLDLNRVLALLENGRLQLDDELKGKFTSPLSNLLNELDTMETASKDGLPADELWNRLAKIMDQVQIEIDSQMEILGGLGIKHGVRVDGEPQAFDGAFSSLAESWLNEFRKPLNLGRTFVLVGRGPLLDPGKGIVRVPFLDWDYWHLPLLGRALGLVACEDGSYQKKILPVFEHILKQVEDLLDGNSPAAPPDLERLLPEAQTLWQNYQQIVTVEGRADYKKSKSEYLVEVSERQRQFLSHLFAEIYATAVLGPAYAIPVFVFELDYGYPIRNELTDPDQIEARETAPRFLPAAVHRASAILATLDAMDQEEDLPYSNNGSYQAVIQRLRKLWQEALASTQQTDTLDSMLQRYGPWYETMYQKVVRQTLRTRIFDPINHNGLE